MNNETFIKLVIEFNNKETKRKRDRIKIFIYLLIKEKNIHDSNLILNYCYGYYGCCRNIIHEVINEMKEQKILRSMKKLGDTRKKLLFV